MRRRYNIIFGGVKSKSKLKIYYDESRLFRLSAMSRPTFRKGGSGIVRPIPQKNKKNLRESIARI